MSAVDVLIWLGVIFAALVVLSAIAFFVALVWGGIISLRKMRDDDESETSIFKSGGER